MPVATPQQMRFERKFFVPNMSAEEVCMLLKTHPLCFSEIYHQRWINNMYFDTHDFHHYKETVAGVSQRKKYRIRWYGNLHGMIEQPQMEVKEKQGLLVQKYVFPLPAFTFGPLTDKTQLQTLLSTSPEIPLSLKHTIASMRPVLVNRYARRYFQTADKRYRTTIDTQMSYGTPESARRMLVNKTDVIVEVKYAQEADDDVDTVSRAFPFRLTKQSKYTTGVDVLYNV